jgi:hypothetical protein
MRNGIAMRESSMSARLFATAGPDRDLLTAKSCVERYLYLQSKHDWREALSLISDECLRQKWGLFRDNCTEEAAHRYGYPTGAAAHLADIREFVTRMLESSARDADGANPAAAAIPQISDCYIACRGDDEVEVTLSTPNAVMRTRYQTGIRDDGTRVIHAMKSEHVPMA